MTSQWQNFLLNRGEWHGSFTSLTADGIVTDSTPSILSLDPDDDDRLVRFHLRRFGSEGLGSAPTREVRTDYRTLGRQVVFFDTGSFSKGSLQVAPNTPSGSEFGFIDADRRFRLVQLFTDVGAFDGHVLIREFRAGTEAQERPPLSVDHLCGIWRGQASTITADWPLADQKSVEIRLDRSVVDGRDHLTMQTSFPSDSRPCSDPCASDLCSSITGSMQGGVLCVEGSLPRRWHLLPDGGYSLVPLQVSHRQAFLVEAGWMPASNRLVRLIRCYDATGAWQSSTHISVTRS